MSYDDFNSGDFRLQQTDTDTVHGSWLDTAIMAAALTHRSSEQQHANELSTFILYIYRNYFHLTVSVDYLYRFFVVTLSVLELHSTPLFPGHF